MKVNQRYVYVILLEHRQRPRTVSIVCLGLLSPFGDNHGHITMHYVPAFFGHFPPAARRGHFYNIFSTPQKDGFRA